MTRNGTCQRYSTEFDIILKVENERFEVEKDFLRKKCPYFEVMFNGKFAEGSQQEVVIEMISAKAMKFALDFLHYDSIAFDFNDAVEFIQASMFFQLQKLVDSIMDSLSSKLNPSTWGKIWQIAKIFNLSNLENRSRFYGLCEIDNLRNNIDNIDNLSMLHWYLSHVYLNAPSEYDVFDAGCEWLLKHKMENMDKNDILVVLSCLNYRNMNTDSLQNILKNNFVQKNEVAVQIVESIIQILSQNIDLECPTSSVFRNCYLNHISEDIYNTICGFLLSVKHRISIVQPCVIRKRNNQYLKMFDSKSKELVNWLKLPNKNWWGYNVVMWNDFNVLVLGGEASMGKNIWNTDILCFNILEEKWTILNSKPLVPRRHSAVVVHENILYVIGGVNSHRVSLASIFKYNLYKDSWDYLPDLPECCQTPVAAFHKGELYVSAEMLYVFRENKWVLLFKNSMRHNAMLSYKNCLYFSQNWRNTLSCWDTDSEIQYMRVNERQIKKAEYNITAMCQIGKYVYLLTEPEMFEKQTYCIERCDLEDGSENTELLMETSANSDYSYNTSDCIAVPNMAIEDVSINNYGRRWLDKNECDYFYNEPSVPNPE